MSSRKNRSKEMQVINLWDWGGARKAVPYLRSIIGSIRQHWLDVRHARRQLELADTNTSASKRAQYLTRQSHEDDLQRAETKFNDALDELNRIDAFLVEPVRGLAFLPFRHGDELAWYVFDLFTKDGLTGWRFHEDPIEASRPLSELPSEVTGEPDACAAEKA